MKVFAIIVVSYSTFVRSHCAYLSIELDIYLCDCQNFAGSTMEQMMQYRS